MDIKKKKQCALLHFPKVEYTDYTSFLKEENNSHAVLLAMTINVHGRGTQNCSSNGLIGPLHNFHHSDGPKDKSGNSASENACPKIIDDIRFSSKQGIKRSCH